MKVPPLLAAIANVIFPGAGYILIEKRVVFGYLLFAGTLLSYTALFFEATTGGPVTEYYDFPLYYDLIMLSSIILMAGAFAYDVYSLAKEN